MDSNADNQKYTVICSERVVIGNTLVPATVHFEYVLLPVPAHLPIGCKKNFNSYN